MTASDNGQPSVAARHLRAALRLTEDDRTRGRLLLSLAWAESEQGHVAQGFDLLDEADPLIPDGERPILSAQRALMLKRTGRNDEALVQYNAAIAGLSTGDQPLHLVKALNNRSMVHLEAGRVRHARADLHRCRDIAEQHGLAVHVAIGRMNLGCLDVIAGDLPSALKAFAAARTEYEALIPGRLGNLAVERAKALVAAGLFAEADRELAYALEQADRQQLSNTYANALLVRAEAALLAGRPAASADFARQAQERFTSRTNARWAALAALLELRADHAAGVSRLAGRARTLAARLDRLGLAEDARVAALVAARCLAGTPAAQRIAARYGPPGRGDRLDTRLLWRLTQAEIAPAHAERHLLAGLRDLHRHRVQLGSLDLQTGAAVHGRDLSAAGLARALANRRASAAFRWSERARAQALLLPRVRPPDDSATAAALEELRQLQYSLRAAEVAGRTTRGVRTRIEALQRTIRERSWAAPGQASARPVTASLGQVRSELGDAALVVHLRNGSELWALVVTSTSASLVCLGEYRDAEEAVLRLRADLDAQAGRAMPARLADAVAEATRRDREAVAAATLAPLLPLIGDRDLVVVPTGLLMTTPWSVLPGCSGRPITLAPSATAWLAAMRRLRTPAVGPALLVAGPGTDRGEAEVREIASLYDATVLWGASATPAAVLAGLGGASLAHVAAHGHHRSENALFSTLELSGGALMGYDLQGVPRMPPIMVLSACDLGLTDIRPGDETFGMATAMLTAGAAAVVASVTRVADDAATAIMTRFHRLVSAGRTPAAALAEAMPSQTLAGFVCFGAG
jgi:tetratricopeptide (TPR) repeat protein